MKTVKNIFLSILISALLVSCYSGVPMPPPGYKLVEIPKRFEVLTSEVTDGMGFVVIRDKTTGVCYLRSGGGLVVMPNTTR